MKVTKAKGLNTIRLVEVAADPRRLLMRRAGPKHRARVGRHFGSKWLGLQQPNVLASGSSQIVFRPSSLGPFFWASRRKDLAGRARPAGCRARHRIAD
ncbi:MAG TPA: hypothetical protein PLX45_12820 [Piscinibacter sp.]|nr:hypothetical protein [Piscinibacter sp.]